MSARDDLIEKLREIFELDKADLDFGLYRILRVRRERVEDYLARSLPAKVASTLAATTQDDSAGRLKKAREALVTALGDTALAPDGTVAPAFAATPAGKAYAEALAAVRAGGDTAKLEAEVYRHLHTFFARYYEAGDFISQRRYTSRETGPTYAIPYAGEEVMLHWANKDQ